MIVFNLISICWPTLEISNNKVIHVKYPFYSLNQIFKQLFIVLFHYVPQFQWLYSTYASGSLTN